MHWKYGSFPRLRVKCNHPVGSIHVCTCCMSPGSYMLASVHVCTCCMSPGSYMLASIHVCTCCMSPGSYMLASAGSIMQSTEQEDICLCNTTSNTLFDAHTSLVPSLLRGLVAHLERVLRTSSAQPWNAEKCNLELWRTLLSFANIKPYPA